jgi:cyanosortase A-associated protein
MSLWKQLRIPLLILTFANILFVFGRSVLDPSIGKRTLTPFVFPPVVPLPQWQLVASQPLKAETVELQAFGKLVLPGREYRYIQNDLPLDIKMRYQVETDGDFKEFIKKHTNIKFSLNQPLPDVRQHEQLGFYGLFVYQKRAYLNACINSRGGSTFTKEQFNYNRIHHDTQFNRLLAWLLVQQPLRDKRCLWTHLSVPLNRSSPESAYVILEKAWFSWYQWWRPRFPKL